MTNVKCKTLRLVVLSIALHTFTIEHLEATSISQQQQQQQHSTANVKHSAVSNDAGPQQQVKQQTLAQLIASTGSNPLNSSQQVDEIAQIGLSVGGTKGRLPLQQESNNSKKRSESGGEEDQLPLATINNHHSNRNNNNNNNVDQVAQLRPPQYVDVSALVGRNASISSSTNSYSTSNGNSLLTPKSRSGLPECATQQVCNAIFVRMNYTQRLCECSSNYNWKCSNNLDPQDGHTIELTRKFDKRIYTQIKTCEPLREVRACKSPTDWTLLALQSERSGKAHYVVVCKCPTWAQLEGPYTHNHPPYANIPGIRVYGMLCAHQTARSSSAQTYASYNPALSIYPEFPWSEALNVLNTTNLTSALDSH